MPKLGEQLGKAADVKNTKATKAEANYRHATYVGSGGARRDHCGSCKFYEPDEHHEGSGTCSEVAGSIKFDDVCDYYSHRVHGGSVESDSGESDSEPLPAAESEPGY